MGVGNTRARILLTHSVVVLSDMEPEAVSCIGYIVAVSKMSKSVGESMPWPGGRKTGRGSLGWRGMGGKVILGSQLLGGSSVHGPFWPTLTHC
jgi:hypothetical protein